MYAGRKLQSVSTGATTDLLDGPDRSRGGRRIEGHGTRRMRGGGFRQEDVGVCPEASWIAATAPGALWEAHRQN